MYVVSITKALKRCRLQKGIANTHPTPFRSSLFAAMVTFCGGISPGVLGARRPT